MNDTNRMTTAGEKDVCGSLTVGLSLCFGNKNPCLEIGEVLQRAFGSIAGHYSVCKHLCRNMFSEDAKDILKIGIVLKNYIDPVRDFKAALLA